MTTPSLGKRPIGFVGGRVRDFPTLNPRWHRVKEPQLSTPPWASVCAISSVKDGTVELEGTGWLAAPTTIITAAHVVATVAMGTGQFGLQVQFPGTEAPVSVVDAHVHESYRGDLASRFDPFDIAALRIEPSARVPLSIADAVPSNADVEVPGYPPTEDGALVTHEATALRPGGDVRLVLHDVDTIGGHSGAPVLLTAPGTRSVIALHIANFNANPFDAEFPSRNVALAIDGQLTAFIRSHLAA